ncbi:hypothetical protein J4227_07615 [Candidatus Woesearchaeota archaeon]|nr:hypothetical protein [Candidatus Woesearchaeota archaeon]
MVGKGSDSEDDEISIDFSKIKGFFSGRKKSEKARHSKKQAGISESKQQAKEESQRESARQSQEAGDQNDDDISIDFSKIKNIFSKSSKARKSSTADSADSDGSDDVVMDAESLDKAKSYIKKFWPYLLILIPIFITIFVRAHTVNLAVTDTWARNSVYDFYRSQIEASIRQQNPGIDQNTLGNAVAQNLQTFIEQRKAEIDQQVVLTSGDIKNYFQYQSGDTLYPYMGDIDSYYFLRQARNLAEKGHICDVIENGVCYDAYTVAPNKLVLPKTLHPYSIYYLYSFLKIFNKDITLMQAQIYVPTLYAIIAAILVYLMMLKLFGPLAALTGSTLLSVNPIFLTRSLGSDTDVYNVFFPVLIIFLAFEAFTVEDIRKKIIFAALAGLAVGSYSFAWIGWWYLFDFIAIAVLGNYALSALRDYFSEKKPSFKNLLNDRKTKEMVFLLATFAVVALLAVGLIAGFKQLPIIYKGPFGFLKAKVAANPNIWPNVLTTVAEFNAASIPQIVSQAGGKWWFFMALLGFIVVIYKNLKNVAKNVLIFLLSAALLYYLVTPKGTSLPPITYLLLFGLTFALSIIFVFKSQEEVDVKLGIMFFLWVAASIYAATSGIRFTLLLVPPIAIGIGITFGFLHETITYLLSKAVKINRAIISIIIFLVFAYYLVSPVRGGIGTASSYLPNVNDQWWEDLTAIKENSQPDAIINSWWDFGHWFKFIADRRVTLDGSSQNNPQLHWLGRSLLTPSDNEARGILRMLDCGGNNAFKEIDAKKQNTPNSVQLLRKIIVLQDRGEAKNVLAADGFSDSESEKVLQYSHCNAPENFFITSEDMIGKGGVWAHFGSWSFERAWMHRQFDDLNSESKVVDAYISQFGMSREDALSYYNQIRSLKTDAEINQWIAPWPSYLQGEAGCTRQSEAVICQAQDLMVYVNLTNMDVYVPTQQGVRRMDAVSYTTPESYNTIRYASDTVGVGMVFMFNSDGSYSSLFMSPQLVNSTFTKLFYLNGHGTQYFQLFRDSKGMNNFKIKIWKVDWEGKNPPIHLARFNATNPYFGRTVEQVRKMDEDAAAKKAAEEEAARLKEEAQAAEAQAQENPAAAESGQAESVAQGNESAVGERIIIAKDSSDLVEQIENTN